MLYKSWAYFYRSASVYAIGIAIVLLRIPKRACIVYTAVCWFYMLLGQRAYSTKDVRLCYLHHTCEHRPVNVVTGHWLSKARSSWHVTPRIYTTSTPQWLACLFLYRLTNRHNSTLLFSACEEKTQCVQRIGLAIAQREHLSAPTWCPHYRHTCYIHNYLK